MQSVSTKSGEKEEMLNIYIKKVVTENRAQWRREKNSFIKLKNATSCCIATLYVALLLNFVGQQWKVGDAGKWKEEVNQNGINKIVEFEFQNRIINFRKILSFSCPFVYDQN